MAVIYALALLAFSRILWHSHILLLPFSHSLLAFFLPPPCSDKFYVSQFLNL